MCIRDRVTGAHFVDEALALGVDQHGTVAAQALGDQGSGCLLYTSREHGQPRSPPAAPDTALWNKNSTPGSLCRPAAGVLPRSPNRSPPSAVNGNIL